MVIANLAEKSGAALAPVVSQIGKEAGKSILSFGIMPFKFEKDRIFFSGVSLKRLKTNSALLHVISTLKNSSLPLETSILSTSKDIPDVETSLRDSIKMLYEDAS